MTRQDLFSFEIEGKNQVKVYKLFWSDGPVQNLAYLLSNIQYGCHGGHLESLVITTSWKGKKCWQLMHLQHCTHNSRFSFFMLSSSNLRIYIEFMWLNLLSKTNQ